VARATITSQRDAQALAVLLDSPEISSLVADLQTTRWTGRPGYPIRAMVGMALLKSLHCHPTWTRTVRLVAEHDGLQRVLGCAPSLDACYRFTRKLREHNDVLASCIAAVLARLGEANPDMGESVPIDGSDLPAYANGQRHLFNHGPLRERYSDPDATWGHRSAISTRKGGGYYCYKVHAVVDVATELPIAWEVRTAADAESLRVADLLVSRNAGLSTATAILDRGYDVTVVYEACESRGIRPIIPLRMTPGVKLGRHNPPSCEHGDWTFAGADSKRGATKWRCPTAECSPASTWIKADRLHTMVPRTTKRWKDTYKQRGCVERGFGRLKHEWGLLPLRVRGIDRVRLHVDLTMLAQLATALVDARHAAMPIVA
jgi:hypothetical protein